MGENSEVRFKTTTENVEKIKRNAEKCGMTIKEFLLHIALSTEINIIIKSRE